MRATWPVLLIAVAALVAAGPPRNGRAGGTVRIPAGAYVPLYGGGGAPVRVAAFELDRRQVTRAEFAAFVDAHAHWRRSRVAPLFAGPGYLADWIGDVDPGPGGDRPVTGVSWFAARSYCEWVDMRLPTADEWEYAAGASATRAGGASDPSFRRVLLELYTAARPATLPAAGSGFRNWFGVTDMHGPVREWVLDFNNVIASDDARGTSARDRQLYCAAGAATANDPSDYPAFLRYALRASLGGSSTLSNLGFRCKRSVRP